MERTPILRIGEFLLVTIQVDMHDQLAMNLQDDLSSRIQTTGARGVLLDISALSRVLDATTVVVGMQPAVAITLVELGMTLPGVRTALNAELGMQMLSSAVASEESADGGVTPRRQPSPGGRDSSRSSGIRRAAASSHGTAGRC